jgi:malate synthase
MIKALSEKKFDARINHAPPDFDAKDDLPKGFDEFFEYLHREFTPRQQKQARKRAEVLQKSHEGVLPNYLPASEATKGDWKIVLPKWCEDQRNQMTGPADDGELVVKMLNSGAPGVMIDLEDSMANSWENLEKGIENSLKALHGELSYFDKKREKEVSIKENSTVIWIRLRGLHLTQAGILPDELASASVYDAARIAFGVDRKKLKHPLCFYIPKSESAEEALFWRDLFQTIEDNLGWEKGFMKCMALVEAHPLAFQMEEFIYNLREHILGLNLGRWDYMASLIHFNMENPEWVLPDRNTIPSDVPFFQNLRELLVEICHKRGILAIGGMTALFPNRQDKELNERALKVLEADKKNEASVGMDGAWTGHPDQNEIAVAQFPFPNQNFVQFDGRSRYPDLRPTPKGIGKHTVDGTRAAVRTVIGYRHGVLSGKGAVLLDGYMEDLATDRIYRLMIAQRMKHRNEIKIATGSEEIKHTPELIGKIFDEELAKILSDLPADIRDKEKTRYAEARRISEELILNEEFDPI